MTRNFDNIQHEKLRKKVDGKFNQAHDKLADDLRADIITKAEHDEQHGQLWQIYAINFHVENLKQAPADIIPESKYHEVKDANGAVVSTQTEEAVKALNTKSVATLKKIIKRIEDKGTDLTELKVRMRAEGKAV